MVRTNWISTSLNCYKAPSYLAIYVGIIMTNTCGLILSPILRDPLLLLFRHTPLAISECWIASPMLNAMSWALIPMQQGLSFLSFLLFSSQRGAIYPPFVSSWRIRHASAAVEALWDHLLLFVPLEPIWCWFDLRWPLFLPSAYKYRRDEASYRFWRARRLIMWQSVDYRIAERSCGSVWIRFARGTYSTTTASVQRLIYLAAPL